MYLIKVGIGQYAYDSLDGGVSWVRSLREVPGKCTPVVRGNVNLTLLPARPDGTIWDFVTVLRCGFGVAVDHETTATGRELPQDLAHVFLTHDGGRTWHEHQLRVNWGLRTVGKWLGRPSWPVEQFHSLVLATPDNIVLAWEDPWIYEGSQSHVLCSHDRGKTWDYHCLGRNSAVLACDCAGRSRALNNGFNLESADGGKTWSRREFAVAWPEHDDVEKVNLLRQVAFVRPNVAFALIVHWRRSTSYDPHAVGLVATIDDGKCWRHVHVFEGPNIGDVNERHILTLNVVETAR